MGVPLDDRLLDEHGCTETEYRRYQAKTLRIVRAWRKRERTEKMSWSIYANGTPAAVAKYVDSQKMTDERSNAEMQAAKPHLLALIGFNSGKRFLKLSASGSATHEGGKMTDGSCQVSIESLYFVEE